MQRGSSFGGSAAGVFQHFVQRLPGFNLDGIDDCLVCTDAALLTGLPAGDAGGELWSLAQNDNLVAGATFFDLFGYANASQRYPFGVGRRATA